MNFLLFLRVWGTVLSMLGSSTWLIYFQVVLPMMEKDGLIIGIFYFLLAIALINSSVGSASITLYIWGANKCRKQKHIALAYYTITSCCFAIVALPLAVESDNQIVRGLGYAFGLGAAPSNLIVALSGSLPVIDPDNYNVNGGNAIAMYNLYGIIAFIMVISGSTWAGAGYSTMAMTIMSTIWNVCQLDFSDDPENVAIPENKTPSLFGFWALNQKYPVWVGILLIVNTFLGISSVIFPFTGSYHIITEAYLGEPVDELIHLYGMYAVWSAPISVIILMNLLPKLRSDIDWCLFLYCKILLSVCVCLSIGSRTSLTIWGFLDAALSIPFFVAMFPMYMNVFKEGLCVYYIVLAVSSIINIYSMVKVKYYGDPNMTRIVTLTEAWSAFVLIVIYFFGYHYFQNRIENNDDVNDVDAEKARQISGVSSQTSVV